MSELNNFLLHNYEIQKFEKELSECMSAECFHIDEIVVTLGRLRDMIEHIEKTIIPIYNFKSEWGLPVEKRDEDRLCHLYSSQALQTLMYIESDYNRRKMERDLMMMEIKKERKEKRKRFIKRVMVVKGFK